MKHLKCAECRRNVSSKVPDNIILRGIILCPECLEEIPDDIANKFLGEWAKVGKIRRETTIK